MKSVSTLEFRHDARRIIQQVKAGESMVLTYRREPVMRLEPVAPDRVREDDPFYRLVDIAEEGDSISNREIDRAIYGAA